MPEILSFNSEDMNDIKNAVHVISREFIRTWSESHSSPPIDAANAIEVLFQFVDKIDHTS